MAKVMLNNCDLSTTVMMKQKYVLMCLKMISLLEQLNPVPLKPSSQVQLKDPSVS